MIKVNAGTFMAVQWLRLHLPMQEVQVLSLVGKGCLTVKKPKHKTEAVL